MKFKCLHIEFFSAVLAAIVVAAFITAPAQAAVQQDVLNSVIQNVPPSILDQMQTRRLHVALAWVLGENPIGSSDNSHAFNATISSPTAVGAPGATRIGSEAVAGQ